MFLYETHLHTALVSKCAKISPEQIVELYEKNGYDGVFVTDHFLNGNCYYNGRDDLSYAERVHLYAEGYRAVKAAAGDRLQVFFGFEYSYRGTDILFYGWDEDALADIPEALSLKPSEFIKFANERGILTVQAHPFREAAYIDHIRLFPGTEGVEVYNAGRTDLANDLAYQYATAYGKIKTGGSDLHSAEQSMLSGVAFHERITSEAEFIDALRAGKGTVVKKPNVYQP